MEEIEIIKQPIKREDLKKFLGRPFKTVVKFVVDIKQEVIAVGGELHIDAAELLTEQKSSQGRHLWGGNFYPSETKGKNIEYVSLINIKPSINNYSMQVKNKDIQEAIKKVVDKFIV